MGCPVQSQSAADDDQADRVTRIARAVVRCQPLMYAVILLGTCIWWTWRDASEAADLAAAEAESARKAATSAKYEARDAKEATRKLEDSIERQLSRVEDTLNRLVSHMMEERHR